MLAQFKQDDVEVGARLTSLADIEGAQMEGSPWEGERGGYLLRNRRTSLDVYTELSRPMSIKLCEH